MLQSLTKAISVIITLYFTNFSLIFLISAYIVNKMINILCQSALILLSASPVLSIVLITLLLHSILSISYLPLFLYHLPSSFSIPCIIISLYYSFIEEQSAILSSLPFRIIQSQLRILSIHWLDIDVIMITFISLYSEPLMNLKFSIFLFIKVSF